MLFGSIVLCTVIGYNKISIAVNVSALNCVIYTPKHLSMQYAVVIVQPLIPGDLGRRKHAQWKFPLWSDTGHWCAVTSMNGTA